MTYQEIMIAMFDHVTKPGCLAQLLERCEGAYSPRTLSSYANDLRCFQRWCTEHGQAWLPANAATIAAFVDAQISAYKISTIKRRVVAIAFAHRMLDLPSPVEHSSVHLALRRARRARAQRPDQVRGLTHDILQKIVTAPMTSLAALRDAALIAVGYDTLCRSAEIVDMRIEHLRHHAGGARSMLIPRSKADVAGNGRVAYLSPATAKLLDRWLAAAGITAGPLFRGLHLQRPSERALDLSSVRRIVKRAARNVGLPASIAEELSGHSMRIGAAQDMLVAGFDALAIMQAGGWTTAHVVIRYVENASTHSLHERRWAAMKDLNVACVLDLVT